jgi:hypothetical protein
MARAAGSVFWPGMRRLVQVARAKSFITFSKIAIYHARLLQVGRLHFPNGISKN